MFLEAYGSDCLCYDILMFLEAYGSDCLCYDILMFLEAYGNMLIDKFLIMKLYRLLITAT
jgi:hypothetical protein